MRTILFALTVALLLVGVASAAPVYWTPAQMRAVAPQLPGPLVTIETATILSNLDGTPTCVGIGTARAGAFPGYRCKVAWKRGFTMRGTANMWVRPRTGGYCVSSIGFGSCPAAPRPDDPRVCGTSRADVYAENCTTKAAREAVGRAVKAAGRIAVNLGCVPRSTLVIACDWGGGTATVTFTLGTAWRTNVALTPSG